jgi:hypothetical protein
MMALIRCEQCGQEYEEDLFLCPHCGSAQIPQMSKADLRMENLKAARGPLGAILIGTAVGLLLGVIILVVAIYRDEAGLPHGAGMLLGGMLGGAVGLLVHRFFLAGRQ